MFELLRKHSFRSRTAAAERRHNLHDSPGQRPPAYWVRTLASAVLGTTLSLAAWLVTSHWEDRVAELEFTGRASNLASTLQTGLNEYLAKIVALRALFEASDNKVTRQEFQNFADRILQNQPAILSVSWIPRVSRDDRLAHEEAAVRNGISNYRIRKVSSDGSLVTSPEESEYFPVYYTTERHRADAIYGLDLGDGGMREDTLARARDTDDLAASRSLVLQTGAGDRRGFFVVLPLYKHGAEYRTLEERQANLTGFVQGVFKIDVMVDTILSGITSPVNFFVYPSGTGTLAEPLHVRIAGSWRGHVATRPPADGRFWAGQVKVADLRWTLVAVPSAARTPSGHLSAWILLGAGLVVTAIGSAFAWSSGRHSWRLIEANRRTSELALTDVLTGLANRRAFCERLQTLYSGAGRNAVSVLYVDLDDFKDVNDTLGHSTGDMLLRQAARRLRNTVEANDLVARFGGDEFAILRCGSIDRTALMRLASEIVTALAAEYDVDGNTIRITASVGIACSSHEAAGPEAILMQADLALYRAKEDGRNCFRFHDSALDQKLRERVMIGDELRTGIARGELRLHYQPQVEITTGRLIGLEALVRWQHPTRDPVPPSVFIPIAEKTGAIIPLGAWVFEEACRQLAAWCAEGIAPKTLAVNLSAIQFRHPNLESEFGETVARYGIPAGILEVELTETVLMDTTSQQRDLVERLKSLGLKIAIDDFGTGYSSLNYLAAYPVDRLKIAQQLVFGVTVDLKHDLVVKAAVRLAHELGIEVIAEGVETQTQARFLVEAGCQCAQGFFFSPPLSAGATTALLRQGGLNHYSPAKATGAPVPESPPPHSLIQSANGA